MAENATDVCNLALYEIGSDKITTTQFTTPDNNQSRACEEFYAQSSDEVLVMTRPGWNCAKKRLELAVDNSEPLFDYNCKFRLPDDCLRVLYPSDTNGQPVRVDWERRGNYLLINDNECYLVYIKQLTDVKEMTPLLIRAIAFQLAVHICVRLKQSTTLKNNLQKDLGVTIILAEGTEASERFAADPSSVRRTNKVIWADVK